MQPDKHPEVLHKHIIIRAEVANPPMNTWWLERWTKKAEREMNRWLRQLIKDIDMKIMFGPRSEYCYVEGNRGMTSFAIIETSHIVLHSWDECDPGVIQFDVYTCSCLDKEVVFRALERFQPTSIAWKMLDRQTGLTEVQDVFVFPKIEDEDAVFVPHCEEVKPCCGGSCQSHPPGCTCWYCSGH